MLSSDVVEGITFFGIDSGILQYLLIIGLILPASYRQCGKEYLILSAKDTFGRSMMKATHSIDALLYKSYICHVVVSFSLFIPGDVSALNSDSVLIVHRV